MTVTYRTPLLRVTSNGSQVPRVLSARITRGWDQLIAKADLTVPYPPHAQLGEGAKVTISGGATSMPLRFTGFITSHGAELWPSTWTFPCGDALWLAENYRPAVPHDLSGMTDEDAVTYILLLMGLSFVPSLILGTGTVIGATTSAALTWAAPATALDMIRQIDQISVVDHGAGYLTQYRTWVDFGGQIRRSEIANLPGTTTSMSFVEGVDLETASARVERRQPNTSVTAIGDSVSSTADGTNAWAFTVNPWSYLYPMLQTEGQTALVAQYMLQRLGMNLVTVDFKTPREDLIPAIATVGFDSDHERLTLPAFVQNVTTGWFEDGEFSQQIVLASARELNTNTAGDGSGGSVIGPPTVFDPIDSTPIPPGPIIGEPPGGPPVIPDTVTAAFLVSYIDVELVIIADAEVLLYTAVCHDTSTASGGTITSRAWTTAGGAEPATGSDINFNPSWTADELPSASVTLTVTGSVGGTDSVTIPISLTMGVPVRTRDLFAAATDTLEAFSGADRTWRTYATGTSNAIVVANGPLWGDGEKVWRTADYLATAPSSSVPVPGANVLSVWTELDLNENAVAVGLDNGDIALSSDAGATWTPKVGPNPAQPVLKIILSRFNPGQIQAITATGYWVSTDAGATWAALREPGDYRDLDLNPFRSWGIEVTAGSGAMIVAATGSALTGATDDLVCTTSHILADRGYALAADGSAYLLATDAATALTAGTAIPSGSPQHRGMYRDGGAADIVYFAAGTGGVWKTVDGFRATYFQLRKAGVGNAGTGPWPMVGAGELQAAGTPPPPPSPTSPPGTTGACVVAVTPLVWFRTPGGGFTTTVADLSASETRTQIYLAGPFTFSPNVNVLHAWQGTSLYRSTDGMCNATTTGITGYSAVGGEQIWAYDCFHHFIGNRLGVADKGIWFSPDGIAFSKLPGGVNAAGFGPGNFCAGRTRIWALMQPAAGQPYMVHTWPVSGGLPVLAGGAAPPTNVAGGVHCPEDDDSYCIVQTATALGQVTIRVTESSWTNISAQFNTVGTLPFADFYTAPIKSIDGVVWVGVTNLGIVRSGDAGVTWSVALAGTQDNVTLGSISYDRVNDRWWVGGINTGSGFQVWYSDNAGVSWTADASAVIVSGRSHLTAVGSST